MPCITCDNGVEICGPDASQSDCDAFALLASDAEKAAGEEKCPEGWCFVERCSSHGRDWSVFKPKSGDCLKRAYMEYKGWHEQCTC